MSVSSRKSLWRTEVVRVAEQTPIGGKGILTRVPLDATTMTRITTPAPMPVSDMSVSDALVDIRHGWTFNGQVASGAQYLTSLSQWLSDAMADFNARTKQQNVLGGAVFAQVFDKDALPNKHATQAKRKSRFRNSVQCQADIDKATIELTEAMTNTIDLDPTAKQRAALQRAQKALAEALADEEHERQCAANPLLLERLELQPTLPPSMDRVIHDRKGRRLLLQRTVSAAWLSHGRPWSPRLQPKCMVVVDGHCMSRTRARAEFGAAFVDVVGSGAVVDLGDEEHYTVPLMSFLDTEGRHRVKFAYHLSNDVTETDLSAFWHIAAVQPVRCVINSVDTDFLPLSMLFVASQKAPNTELYVALPNVRKGQPPEMLFYHANAMCAMLEMYPALKNADNRVLSFVATLLMTGSDYTPPYTGVPPKHFITALEANRPLSLVSNALSLNMNDYSRLVASAYHAANVKAIKSVPLGSISYAAVREALKTRQPKSQPPSLEELQRRLQAAQEILRIWAQVGQRHTELELPEPLDDDDDDEANAGGGAAAVGSKRTATAASSSSSSSSSSASLNNAARRNVAIIDDNDDDDDEAPLVKRATLSPTSAAMTDTEPFSGSSSSSSSDTLAAVPK